MVRQRWMGLVGGLLVMVLVACTGGPKTAPPPAVSIESQAAVTSVEVLQALSGSGELRALVKGSLPDTCSRLGDPAVDSGGSLIVVILPMYRTAGQNCPASPTPFERAISLNSQLPAGHYTVSVNGVSETFDLAGAGQPAVPASLPTTVAAAQVTATPASPTPTEPAADTSAAQPTAAAPTPTAVPAAAAASSATAGGSSSTANTPQIANTAGNSADCVNKAAFFADVSVPDGTVFDPGQKFTKTWRIRNAGTCTWQGYTMVYQNGSPLGSTSPQVISRAVLPNSTVDISINMLAPDAPGSYYSNWLFSTPDGSVFGLGAAGDGLLWTKVGVRTLVPISDRLAACPSQTDPTVEAAILQLVNTARQQAKLPALKLDSALSDAARGHSKDMACNDFVEHYGSDGSTWYTRIQAEGVKYKSANENIYAGNPAFGGDANGAFTWWMNSKVHHDNILNPLSSRIGIGYIYYSGSTYKAYYTLNFVQ